MIIRITMKTPNVMQEAIDEAVADSFNFELSDDEQEAVNDELHNELIRLCETWFMRGEQIDLEIDSIKKTCTVLT